MKKALMRTRSVSKNWKYTRITAYIRKKMKKDSIFM